jgi:hypothetical protein
MQRCTEGVMTECKVGVIKDVLRVYVVQILSVVSRV